MITAGLIGCGKIAGGYDRSPDQGWAFTHAGAYRLSPRARLIAAADLSPTARDAFGAKWAIDRLYDDAGAMLMAERPDIVSICTPPESHVDLLAAACQVGVRGVWLEKPVATTRQGLERALTVAGTTPVLVNYFRRWNPTLVRLRESLRRGDFGAVSCITVHTVKGVAGNASHFIDLLRWLIGEPTRAHVHRRHLREDGDHGVDFDLEFPDGIVAAFHHLPTPYVVHEVEVFCSRARLTMGQRGQTLRVSHPSEEPHYGGFDILVDEPAFETEWRHAVSAALENLLDCVERGGQPECALADGARSMAWAIAIAAASPGSSGLTGVTA